MTEPQIACLVVSGPALLMCLAWIVAEVGRVHREWARD